MRVRPVGFFSDLPHGLPTEPELRSVVSEVPIPDETDLIGYLEKGVLLIASPGVVHDVLAANEILVGSSHIVTDGVWAWPQDLVYYVKNYHARLPEEFLEHARSTGWMVPEDIEVESLELEP